MKTAFILYQNDENHEVIDFLKKSFEEVFDQYISFTNIFLNRLEPRAALAADAYLVWESSILQDVKDLVDDFSKVIMVTRSPARESLNLISAIPAGTNVLLVNDSYETALDTVYAFYEIGISHINLIPYDSALTHTGIYDQITVAVTPSEPHLVPPHIRQVIDIGYRKVGFDTMFKLMQLLDLDVGIINRNLQRHIHSVVKSNEGFQSNYIYGYLKSEMLSRVVDASENGMLLTDSAYRPVYANRLALKIFRADNKNQIRIADHIPAEALDSQDHSEEPVMIEGEAYGYEKNPIRLMDDVAGYYFILQDYAKVRAQNLSAKQAGFRAKYTFKDILCKSPEMSQLINTARQIAAVDDTVMIYGESGTGKELLAQSIHNASSRRKAPFIAINCAALPDSLLESELFGYEPGSFTGASSRGRKGLFELAMHGTVLLDEIGEISPKFQASFLRALQERQIIRVGGKELIDIDVRFITATNRDLRQQVKDGVFRGDLFFRLNVFPLSIPPLRRRKADIEALLKNFLQEDYRSITPAEFALLDQYAWPGNVRELENACTFYRAMHRFPDYLFDTAETALPAGENIRTEVLRLIGENTQLSHGIGRTSLAYHLQNRKRYISDHQLRTQGLITIRPGRCGAQITEQGTALLRSL